MELTEACLPVNAEEAARIGLVGGVIYSDGYEFRRHIARIATQLANSRDYKRRLKKKRAA